MSDMITRIIEFPVGVLLLIGGFILLKKLVILITLSDETWKRGSRDNLKLRFFLPGGFLGLVFGAAIIWHSLFP